jgi:hypothetical protein
VYQPRGKPTNYGFSQVSEKLGYGIFAYVPQIALPQFQYPMIACDVSEIDQNLIGWEDTVHGMDAHNLIYDIPELAESKDPLFSLVKEWRVASNDEVAQNEKDLEKDDDEADEEKTGEGVPIMNVKASSGSSLWA